MTDIKIPAELTAFASSNRQQLTQIGILIATTLCLYDMTISSLTIPQNLTKLYHLGFIVLLFSGARIYLPWRWIPYIVLITLVGFFSIVVADYPDFAMAHLNRYLSVIIFSYCLFFFLARSPETYVPPLLAGIVFAYLAVVPSVLIYLYPRIQLADQGWVTELPHFGHIRHFGYQGFIAATTALILAIIQPARRWLWASLLVVCLGITVWTGSRGAVAGWLAFVGFSGIFLYSTRKCIRYWLLCVGILVISTLALLLTPSNDLVVEMAARSNPVNLNHITTGRLDFWKHATPFIFERPLLGYGPNGYLLFPGKWPGNAQPHNSLIQIFIEFGVLGGLIILMFFTCLFRQFFRGVKLMQVSNPADTDRLCLLGFLCAFLVFSLVDGLLYHALPLTHFGILCAMLAAFSFPRTAPAPPRVVEEYP